MFCYVAWFSRVEFEIGDGPGWQEPQCRAWMLRRDICRLLSGRWGRSSFFAYYYSSKCLGSSCKFPWFDCFVDVKQCNLFFKKNFECRHGCNEFSDVCRFLSIFYRPPV